MATSVTKDIRCLNSVNTNDKFICERNICLLSVFRASHFVGRTDKVFETILRPSACKLNGECEHSTDTDVRSLGLFVCLSAAANDGTVCTVYGTTASNGKYIRGTH